MPEDWKERYLSGLGTMHICPECGKEFLVGDSSQWVYKRSCGCLCSYSCTRKWDEKHKEKKYNYMVHKKWRG